MPFAGETVLVAVSGGADSLSLLLGLHELRERKKLDIRIVAAHFNHQLRGHASDADEEFVRTIASERGIELAVGHGKLSSNGNLEQNARDARYSFLRSTAENLRSGLVAVAHTVNDQAETFLLNLIRGSGPGGLSGMKPVRELGNEGVEETGNDDDPFLPFSSLPPSSTLLVRPLLGWAKREDTENFCRESGVEFRYDTMNEDMSFKRVRVRKMLLPMLKEFNPRIVETLAQTAELMAVAAARSPDVPIPLEELWVKELRELERPELTERVRNWLRARRGSLRSIGQVHIEAIESLVNSRKSGSVVELPGFGAVHKTGGRLSFRNIKVDK